MAKKKGGRVVKRKGEAIGVFNAWHKHFPSHQTLN